MTTKKSHEQILKEFFNLAESIGMSIYFDSENSDQLRGFVIGIDEFFADLSDGIENLDNYDKVLKIEDNDRESMH